VRQVVLLQIDKVLALIWIKLLNFIILLLLIVIILSPLIILLITVFNLLFILFTQFLSHPYLPCLAIPPEPFPVGLTFHRRIRLNFPPRCIITTARLDVITRE
jgi:hypothetical protein